MANIFQKVATFYKKTNQTFNQASIIIIIIGFGILTLFYINNHNSNTTDNIYASFICPLTSKDKLVTLDTSALKTATELTLINNSTELFSYGLSKNQIPAILLPKFVAVSTVSPCIQIDDQVLVFQYQNTTHIYPKSILNYHLTVNDTIDDQTFVVTYSPLANHYQVFKRSIKNDVLTFENSGMLYKNTELLLDTKTETLWSQLNGKALVGSLIGAQITKYDFQIMDFASAKKKFPNAQYLSFDTGYLRDYSLDPFKDYTLNDSQLVEPISNYSDKLKHKDTVLGFSYNSKKYAVATNSISDNVPTIFKNSALQITVVKFTGGYQISTNGKNIDYDQLYWFVWYDSNPDTVLLQPVN